MILVGRADARRLPLASGSVSAIVCDPPYDLTSGKKGGTGEASVNLDSPYGRARITTGGGGFMGKAWDATGVAFDPFTWREAQRVLKPGGHLVAFGGSRTYHRLTCAIEDAGLEIRDSLMWLYGSGFPKSLDVSKAIDKAAGVERRVTGSARGHVPTEGGAFDDDAYQWQSEYARRDEPASDAARQWEGFGTALKPAFEPIVLARKPLQGTVAANVLAHGTGGLNIDGARIGDADTRQLKRGGGNDFPHEDDSWTPRDIIAGSASGRWPANVLLDEEAAALLDLQTGELTSGFMAAGTQREGIGYHGGLGNSVRHDTHGDSGGASRFFYVAKSSRSEREAGLEALAPVRRSDGREKDIENPRLRTNERRNHHPTVKPVDLMRWLVRLVTPPGGLVLDPFLGSGSTGMAALDEGMRFVGFDLDPEYVALARQRIAHRHILEGRLLAAGEGTEQLVLL